MQLPIKTIIIALCCAAAANAQPVLQGNMPDYGFATSFYVGTNVPSAGTGGANVYWDFSFQSSFNFVGNLEYMDITDTEFETDFPTCNLVARKRMAGDTTYTYYTDLGSQVIINGENMGAMNQLEYTSNKKVLFNFPMNYGDSLIDTWQSTTYNGKVKRYYDGWGTLKTFFLEYDNVVRIKSIDSTQVGSNWNVSTSYTWYTTDALLPVAYFHEPTQQMTVLKMFPVSTGTVNNNIDVVELGPNPLRDRSTLLVGKPEAGMKLVITNAMGQVVKEQAVTGTSTVIERGNLSSGIYFYQLLSSKKIKAKGKLLVE